MSTNTSWRKFVKSPKRDLGLQVGGRIYWVSRRRLANRSPVFQTMLYGEFEESKKEIVKLSHQNKEHILEMLRCLFPTRQGNKLKTKPIDDQNYEVVLKLADEYEINVLMKRCSTFMEKKMVGNDIEKIVELIDRANQYHLKSVVRVGLRCLSKVDPSILLSKPAFTDLSLNLRHAVAMIAWFRRSRPPPAHEYEYLDESENDNDLSDDGSDSCCTSRPIGTRRCKYCGDCRYDDDDDDVECYPICHTCNKKYGSTDFVCKCVDPTIMVELDKLGL